MNETREAVRETSGSKRDETDSEIKRQFNRYKENVGILLTMQKIVKE